MDGGERSERRRALRRVAVVLGVTALLVQLVPYGWQHPNPTVVADAPWPDERVASIARASCYDCHSNETQWGLQSWVAPISWLVRRDVEQGRDELNFSRWDEDDGEADDAAEAVADGSMPPRRYTLVHPGAALSEDERRALIAALDEMDARR